MKKTILVAATVCADQIIKNAIRQYPVGYTCLELPGLLRITHYTNTGAAFSVLSGNVFLIVMISFLMMLGLFWFVFCKLHLTNLAWNACAFLLGGGIGNLIDRIFFAGVTDYIELQLFSFPVFNLADIAITISIITLIVLTIVGKLECLTGDTHE